MGVMYTSLCDHSRRRISISISISRKWVDVEAESETRLTIPTNEHVTILTMRISYIPLNQEVSDLVYRK